MKLVSVRKYLIAKPENLNKTYCKEEIIIVWRILIVFVCIRHCNCNLVMYCNVVIIFYNFLKFFVTHPKFMWRSLRDNIIFWAQLDYRYIHLRNKSKLHLTNQSKVMIIIMEYGAVIHWYDKLLHVIDLLTFSFVESE